LVESVKDKNKKEIEATKEEEEVKTSNLQDK
jgi:hypothetical protein